MAAIFKASYTTPGVTIVERFDPRRGGIRASPDRDFTGPLAATPHQLRSPRVARTRGHRRRPRPMAMGEKSERH